MLLYSLLYRIKSFLFYSNKILQLIGTPTEADLGFLNENAKRYIRQLPLYRRQSLTEKFPHVHPAAIDLVEKMLTFDPRQRITGEFILLTVLCITIQVSTHII